MGENHLNQKENIGNTKEGLTTKEKLKENEVEAGKIEPASDYAKTIETSKETPPTEEKVVKEEKKSNLQFEKQGKIVEAASKKDSVLEPAPDSMKAIKIGKVVINISTGQSGEPLDKAKTILQNLTNQRPCTRRAKQTIRTFGIRKNEPISCMVTLRGSKADEILIKTLGAIGNMINPHNFDRNGNFAFGIKEHIDIPGQRYDPRLGIIGMDVMATVERRGYRVARKRRARASIGHSHRVKREESIEFIKQRFSVEVGIPSE